MQELNTRRSFIFKSIATAGGLTAIAVMSHKAQAQANKLVEDTDPQAQALGYKSDASKVDSAKFAQYKAGQNCGGCVLFQGKAGDASGGCPVFANKQVSSKAWCSAWNKKA